jgi:hypothetical protein
MKRLINIFIVMLMSVVITTTGSGVLFAECMKSHRQHIVFDVEPMGCSDESCSAEGHIGTDLCEGDCLVYHQVKTSEYTQDAQEVSVPSVASFDIMHPAIPEACDILSTTLSPSIYYPCVKGPPNTPRTYLNKLTILII